MKTFFTQILAFIKKLDILNWLNKFEKWFSFIVKLIWIGVFIAFGTYLYSEYKKDLFYINDFKVPDAWEKQGYTGYVVKDAILDEIDKITQEAYENHINKIVKSSRNENSDDTQILSDINVQGFNLRAIVKTILSVLGKEEKTIGGYVIMSDTSQIMAVQISNQVTKQFEIDKNKPVNMLIRDATLHIMRIKQPWVLFNYYQVRKDTIAMKEAYTYLEKNRDAVNDHEFYLYSAGTSIICEDFEKAENWTDSLLIKFPNIITGYSFKSELYRYKLRFNDLDSIEKEKYGQLYIEYLKKAITHNNSYDGKKMPVVDLYGKIASYYFAQQKDYNLTIENLNKISEIGPLPAHGKNMLGYAYLGQKNYVEAEKAIKSAIKDEPEIGNYYDSLAEIYAIQGKDSLSVTCLKKALNAKIKSEILTKEAYKKDPRWKNLQKRKDFQLLLKK